MSTTLALDEPKLKGLAPSCKFVYLILAHEDDWLTSSEVADRTMMPTVTARNALVTLIDVGLVERSPSPTDARTPRYRVCVSD